MNKIESAYKEMMEDVQMSWLMIAYCMKDKALELERELTAVTEQRDRLAEALKRIANNNVQDEPHTCYAYEFGRMEGIAKIALAAVKGGSDE